MGYYTLKGNTCVEIRYKYLHEPRFNYDLGGFQGKTHWTRLQLSSVRKAGEILGFTFDFYNQGLKLDFEFEYEKK